MASNGVNSVVTERLYLSKEPNDEMFVDNCEILHQHQLDGVRFLFKQFKKQKSGVVVNCPSACGKTVLVAVFLQVVQKLLKEPVLILCNQEDEMLYWRETCFRWTQFVDDDIIVESSNANTRNKKIFLKTITEFPSSYLRRKWSIVIYKDDIITKNMSKLIIQSDFKIWLTSMDMLKDLPMLLFIHTWINPKSNLNIDEFQSSKGAKEQMKNIVRLETFLEDILYKNNEMKAFNPSEKLAAVENKDLKRSRKKNKDATGTKIKKSKPKMNSKLLNICVDENVGQEIKCDSSSGSKLPSNMEVGTFDQAEINVRSTNDFTSNNDVNEYIELHSPMNFDNALKDLIHNENNISQSLIENEITLTQNEINHKFIKAQIIPLATSNASDFSLSITTDGIDTSVLKDTGDINILKDKDFIKDAGDISITKDKDSIKDTLKLRDTIENNTGEITNDKFTIEERRINDRVNLSEETVTNESFSVTSNLKAKTTPEKLLEITSKIHELEKKTLEKFKGSLLDSLF